MKTTQIDLIWNQYKFFPYEKKLAIREVQSLLTPTFVLDGKGKIVIDAKPVQSNIEKLVYFSYACIGKKRIETHQFRAENKRNRKSNRQNTKYSVHGLHEYKGKFNPQVVRSLFNIYNVAASDKILDPFCGSGTTLVESAHLGISSIGTDINPLATLISNTKLKTLTIPWNKIRDNFEDVINSFNTIRPGFKVQEQSSRIDYLKKWFTEDILTDIECLRTISSDLNPEIQKVIIITISNLLREYSLQEPKDLRIRRRKTPLPKVSLIEELNSKMRIFLLSLKDYQDKFGLVEPQGKALNLDIRFLKNEVEDESIDFALTSPPYATALPYIDTQRLSLVWLNLINSDEIRALESNLIGSREYSMKSEQNQWNELLFSNEGDLSEEIHKLCLFLTNSLSEGDGFRKRAVPSLLYRYFMHMKEAFMVVHKKLKPNRHFALIIGHNHTTIGGKRTDINTPLLLTSEAERKGFELIENTPLEVYHRYGLNASNAVNKESLLVFKRKA